MYGENMLDFIKNNWKILFSGIGTAIVVAILGYLLRQRRRNGSKSITQNAKTGNSSQVVQAGRDAKVGKFDSKKDD
jgi:putative exporter of polyketide antibiotics